jgi:hypothetical protein
LLKLWRRSARIFAAGLVLVTIDTAFAQSLSDLDALRYIASHSDLIEAFGADPTKGRTHYETWGMKEGRRITFDPARYIASHPDLIQAFKGSEEQATRHYITWGYREGRSVTGFDPLAYIASYADLIAAFATDAIAATKHYINWGYQEGRRVLFDALGYLARHPDLQQAFGADTSAATRHFINWGFNEGRSYSLTVNAVVTGGGTASKTREFVPSGGRTTFAFTPDRGFYLSSVAGCGGQLNGSVFTTGPISASCTVTAKFEPDVPQFISIPNPVDYLSSLCANPSIQFVIPVRLNGDRQTDFIVHYWCSAAEFGRELTTPTPDALVALVSQSDGSYKVDNERVFGERNYKLGGASRKYVRGDINGDGRDDFAFAMNWEDGRSAKDPLTNATQLSVLLSVANDGYRVERLGKPNWNHAVEIVRNVDSVDVVTAGFACCTNLQAFRWQSGSFTDVSTEYATQYSANWAAAFRSIPDAVTGVSRGIVGVASRQVSGANGTSVSETGIQLLERKSSSWSVLTEFWRRSSFTVKWLSWQLTEGTNTVVEIDGKQYFGGAYDEFCVMPPLKSGSPRLVVAKLGVAKDKFGRVLVPGGSYSEREAIPVNMFNFFELTDRLELQSIPSPIVNEEIESNFNFFDCKDINNDDLPDLVVYAFTRPGFNERVAERGKPTVYLNNGNYQLVRADLSSMPGHSAGNELQSIMTDVNGDGVADLVLFGSTTDLGGGAIEIYLYKSGLRL